MSIYATQWALRFPRFGDFHSGCEWLTVLAQAVPALVAALAGGGYRTFLPPFPEAVADDLWAVVLVVDGTAKGAERSGQQYAAPLLALSGKEYAAMPFGVLHARLRAARRSTPACGRVVLPGGSTRLVFDGGSVANASGEWKPPD